MSTGPSIDPQQRALSGVVVRLTGVNILAASLGLITGPIQAQVLGPSGRGEVAAVITTLITATWILDFGLALFVTRARARKTDAALVYGTVVPLSCAFALIGVAAAFPVAALLGQGRDTVEFFIALGLLLSPISVALLTLNGALWGEERWRMVAVIRIAGPLLALVALAVLALAGELTVTSTIVSLLLAGLIANLLVLPAMRGTGRWRFSRPLAGEALAFGAHNWLAGLAVAANLRLDLLLMAGIVSSRQLGLYAVATTVATFSSVFVGALIYGLFPRVARGDPQLARTACRIALLLVTAASAVAALVIPVALPLLFGSDFRDAVPMALILLVASIASAFVTVLSTSVAAAGHPRATVLPQLVGLAVMVPLLIIVLPSTGGLGASVVVSCGGLIVAALTLRAGLAVLGGRPGDYLLPTADDIATVRKRLLARREPRGTA